MIHDDSNFRTFLKSEIFLVLNHFTALNHWEGT